MAQAMSGGDVSGMAPYTLSDMSNDAFGVLDHLGIDSAHVVGASMGGMIVQTMAIECPERLRSVTSIMSTTGDQSVGQATPAAMAALLAPPADGREAMIAQGIEGSKAISGPLWNRELAAIRTAASYDRAFYPVGAAFQMAAIFASGDRTERLADVDLPFLVIHGRADELISWSGGAATAEAVPNADMLVLAQMGHDMPIPLLPQIADAINGIANRG
ncbi:MAG: alpha/beta hydrolase [Acidimicrobiales bacterium]